MIGTGEYKAYFEEKNESKKPMTNAEKYLKEGVDIDTFIDELKHINYVIDWKGEPTIFICYLKVWLKENARSTLTEDERVILRNIRNGEFGKYIGRGDGSKENTPTYYNLYLRGDDESKAYAIGTIYDHLFQFIKERRRIRYKGVVK